MLDIQTAITHLRRADPRLGEVIARAGACTLRPRRNHFATLIESIVGQQVSGKAADAIFARFRALYPGAKFPTPEQVLATNDEALRGAGLSRAKAVYIKDLAAHVHDGRLKIHSLSKLSDDEIARELVAVKGIGEWTAHMFMMFSLNRPDILPTGDLGIQKGMQKLCDLSELPKPKEMIALADARGWRPWRTVASWYVWRTLEAPGGMF